MDDRLGVVLHQAPDVPEPEPEVREEPVGQVVRGDAGALLWILPRIVRGDLGDVRRPERAAVLPPVRLAHQT